MLLVEICTKNKINTFDSFILKSAYDQTCDQIERSKYGPLGNVATVLETMLNQLGHKHEDIDTNKVMLHYRYSELPSPTNELNLVTFEKEDKEKDPRKIRSFPCSPRTANIAMNKWNYEADEANISWGEEVHDPQALLSHKKIELSNIKKRLGHNKKPSELNLMSGKSSRRDSDDSDISSSIEANNDIARNAINGAIGVQSDEESSKDTLKPYRANNYSSSLIAPTNHVKLTKLKREINNQKEGCRKMAETNKEKVKERKQLQEQLKQLKKDIDDIKNGNYTQVTDSDITGSDFINQRQVKATSTRHDWRGKNSKKMVDDILRNTLSSGVGTEYQKIQNRNRFTAANNNRMKPLDVFDDVSTTKKNNFLQAVDSSSAISNTSNDLFASQKAIPNKLLELQANSRSPENINQMIIENADKFDNVLPSTMSRYKPDEFKVADENNDLHKRLPIIEHNDTRNIQAFQYVPHKSYFNPSETTSPRNKKTRKKTKSNAPKPKKGKKSDKVSKTARETASMLPSISPNRHGSQSSNRNSHNFDNSISFYKPRLDITNDSLLQKAYKNILPREQEMLADDIEIQRTSRPSSSHRASNTNNKSFFKNRFKSLEGGLPEKGASTPRLTPMQRRKYEEKGKKKNKSKRSRK